jgi:hypothetical protein
LGDNGVALHHPPHTTSTFCAKQKADAIPTLHYTRAYFR